MSVVVYLMNGLSVTYDRSVVFSGYSSFFQWNWPPRYSLNIVESGVKHHQPNPILWMYLCVRGIDFVFFYDFSVVFWSCSIFYFSFYIYYIDRSKYIYDYGQKNISFLCFQKYGTKIQVFRSNSWLKRANKKWLVLRIHLQYYRGLVLTCSFLSLQMQVLF